MSTVDTILFVAALICFLMSAANLPPTPRVNLQSLGLALCVLTVFV